MPRKHWRAPQGLPYVEISQVVDARPDVVLSHDNTAAIRRIWQQFGQERVLIPDRLAITLDHAVPAPTTKHAQNHAEIRQFVAEQGIRNFFEVGRGICHQVLSEEAIVLPGQLILGADSHTTHFGWLGAFGAGIGRSEVATLWATGELWLRVPESMLITARRRTAAGRDGQGLCPACDRRPGRGRRPLHVGRVHRQRHQRPVARVAHGHPQHDGRVWRQERLPGAG